MRTLALIVSVIIVLSICGCAEKTPAQKMQDDMNRAGKQLNKDISNVLK